MKFAIFMGLIVAWVNALACLNHIDALELEIRGRSDEKVAIVGWFPRYPSAFYEARVKRLEAKRSRGPGLTANDYDDLAVAYEKLGQTDLAIQRIEEKVKKLNQPEFQSAITYPPGHEKRFKETLNPEEYHRYTTHANWGTFLIHRWVAKGMRMETIAEAKLALDHIEKSILINPDAHSGREWIQRDLMKWMIDKKLGKRVGDEPTWTGETNAISNGLAGLVTMGSAWESVDVFTLLGRQLTRDGNKHLAFWARLRVEELQKAGKKSLLGIQLPGNTEPLPDQSRYEREYAKFRRDANDLNRKENQFILDELAKGHHPDTNNEFWFDFKRPPIPEVTKPAESMVAFYLMVLGPPILVVLAIYFLIKKLLKRWRQRRAT